MSTHLERHRAAMEKLAYPAVKQFIAQNPEYSISPDQSGSDSNTNYIIFGQRFGQYGDELVIFKYFCEDERKARESYALRHFAHTGLVPRLLADEGPRLIVQSRIAGGWLPMPDNPEYAHVDPVLAGYTLGQATATLVSVPLAAQTAKEYESTFYDGLILENYLRNILDAAWSVHQNSAAYGDAIFGDSLAHIEANLPYILAQPRLLYHQDAMNMHFAHSRFTGFFDLEMCRVGTEAMQIGSLWYIFARCDNWQAFAHGFANVTGRQLDERDFNAAQAFANFLVWRYATRYGRWRAEAADNINPAEAEAQASQYAASIQLHNRITFAD